MSKVIPLTSVKEKALNHPYMRKLESTLTVQKEILERLELRFKLKRTFRDEWERNEHELLLIRTRGEIQSQQKVVFEREQYYIKHMNQFIKDLEELEKDYEEILLKAKNSNENEHLKKLLDNVKWDIIDSDIEQKIAFYKRIKKMI